MTLTIQTVAALLIGAFYYMVAMVMTVYDGLLSMFFQPIIGCVITGIAIIPCLIVGLPIRLSKRINKEWRKKRWLPFALGTIGFVLMILSSAKENLVEVHDPYIEDYVMTLNGNLAMSGWIITIFAVLHFYPPLKRRSEPGEVANIQAAPGCGYSIRQE